MSHLRVGSTPSSTTKPPQGSDTTATASPAATTARQAVQTAVTGGAALSAAALLDHLDVGTAGAGLKAMEKLGKTMQSDPMSQLQGSAAQRARSASISAGRHAATARVGLANVQAGLDIARAVRTGASADIQQATKSTVSAAAQDAGLAAELWARNSAQRLSAASASGKAAVGLAAVPSATMRAAADVTRAVQTGQRQDIVKAGESVGGAATTAAQATTQSMKAGSNSIGYFNASRAANRALQAADPSLSRAARRSISRAVAESATKSVAKGASARATTAGAQAAARQAATATLRGASPAARAAALRAASTAGARAATGGTAKALARAAGRFAPGVNVAVAAYDTAIAAKDLADPKASWVKKAASVATAAGSGVAATNIPILSQVGAGLSILTGLVRDFSK